MRVAIFEPSQNWQKRYTTELVGIEVFFPTNAEELKRELKANRVQALVVHNETPDGLLSFHKKPVQLLDDMRRRFSGLVTIFVGAKPTCRTRYIVDEIARKGHKPTTRVQLSAIIKETTVC